VGLRPPLRAPVGRPPVNDGPFPWLLYGAYGYTGRLLATEAVHRGHRPILAGRNRERLNALSLELGGGLPIRAFPLDDAAGLEEGVAGVSAVLHAAGPFVETGRPMMEACLGARVHYLDITGEVPVFETAFGLDPRAREQGVMLMPGVGLDVVPTDGAAALLAQHLPSAQRLELALNSPGGPSSGTLQTILEGIPRGLLVRRGGRLLAAAPGRREFRRQVDFGPEVEEGPMAGRLGGRRWVAPYTWGDLSTAWRTTGIPDITCYMATPRGQVRLLPVALPLLRAVLSVGPLRRHLRARVARRVSGPDPERRRVGRTRVWGRVEDDQGGSAEVVLEIPEGYRFTALAGIRALEEVLKLKSSVGGVMTPAGAFGWEWILGLPEVTVIRRPGDEAGDGGGPP